jgi:hypothetical protein
MKLDNMFKDVLPEKKGISVGNTKARKFRRDFCVNVTNVRKQLLQRTL